MNLRHLRTFIAIADAGGVSRAMHRLHLSQPAVSRQVSALEDELGVVLFERSGRGVRLTSHGEDLLRHSRVVLSQAESLRERAQALNSGRSGVLRIGASPQVIENPLAPYLKLYRRAFADVEVRLLEEGGARLPARLADGDVHVAMLALHDERFETVPLFPACLLAVVPKGHPFSRRRTLEVSDLAGHPVMVGNGFASRVWFHEACASAHLKPNVVLESGAPRTMIALVESGFAIAVVPSNVSIREKDVHVITLVQGRRAIGRWLTAGWNPERFLPPYAERFIEGLAAYCRRKYPGRGISRHAPTLPPPT